MSYHLSFKEFIFATLGLSPYVILKEPFAFVILRERSDRRIWAQGELCD
jgi:hypothetical protein